MSDPRSRPETLEELLASDAFVRRFARGLVADEGRAEDLAQRALTAGLESGPREPARLRGWLAGTLRRMAARDRRADARRRWREEAAARHEGAPSVAELFEREQARRRVVDALMELEEPYRSTLVLRFYEGLPPRRIAQRLDVPPETVRTRVKRGLAMLRARLDAEFEGGRGAWCALLLPLTHGAGPAALAEGVRELALEALTMTTKTKLAAGAAALVALALVAARLNLLGGDAGTLDAREAGALAPGSDELPAAPAAEEPGPAPETGTERALAAQDEPAAEDEAEEPPPPFGSVLVEARWHDGTPAARVWVRALPWGAAHPMLEAQLRRTDARGRVRYEGLAAGMVGLYALRGGGASAELAPGEEAEVELTIPRGCDLVGTVVDQTDRPVSGADIWLSVAGNTDDGAVVTRSDADGAFRLRSVSDTGWVGARSAEHAPSLVKMLIEHEEGTEVPLRLVLRGECGRVEGGVHDPAGAPVEGALVRVGSEELRWIREDGESGALAPAFEARTDQDGRFALEGIAVGPTPVAVRAAGYALWRGEAQVLAGLTARVDVGLVPGARVAGVVRDAAGEPVQDVAVRSGHWGRMGFRTNSGADGAFVLADLPAGELTVEAEGGERGEARAVLHVLAGETTPWDPVLSTGGEVRGRVMDERGQPLAGWSVTIESLHDGAAGPIEDYHHDLTKTDEAGGFLLKQLADRDHEVEVRAPQGGIFPSLTERPVRPGDVLELYVPDSSVPSVLLVGRVVDADGAPVPAAVLNPWSGFGVSPIEAPDAEGRFELGPYPPGDWTLAIEAPGGVVHRRGPRALDPGESWDMGTIVLGATGSLVVALTRAEGAPERAPRLRLDYAGARPDAELALDGALARAEGLAPGGYLVQVSGRGYAAAVHACEVRAGEETRLDVTLQPGALRDVRVTEGTPSEERPLQLRLVDAGGRLLLETWTVREPGAAWQHGMWLAPGEYTLELGTLDGRELTSALTIADLAPAPEPLELRLE